MQLNRELIDSYEDKELIQFLYSNFKEKVPITFEMLKGVCAANDGKSAKRFLHSLKNLFGNIGDSTSAQYCQDTEDRVDSEGCEVVLQSLQVLEKNYVDAHIALKKVMVEKFGEAQ